MQNGIEEHRQNCKDAIKSVDIAKGRIKSDMLDEKENHQPKWLLGQFNWVCNQTCPDILFDSSETSRSLKNTSIEDVLQANKIVTKLKFQSIKLTFQSISNILTSENIVYSNASFINLKDVKSQGGCIFFIKSKNGAISFLSSKSRKIKVLLELHELLNLLY